MSLNMEQMKLSGFEPDPDLKWEKIADMAAPPGLHENIYNGALVPTIAAIDERRVLVIDHVYSDITESFVREFDTRTKAWSDEEWPSLNQPRFGFSCAVCNDKVYVIGGLNSDNERLDSIECLDLSVSPRRWTTLGQTLETARNVCKCVAIGAQVFILGGYGEGNNVLVSVEILNTETGQLFPGPDLPPCRGFTTATVNNELFVFAKPASIEGGIGEIHTLRHGQPNSTWETKIFSLQNETLVYEPIVIGDCVFLSLSSVYDTKRCVRWNLPTKPFTGCDWTVLGGSEIFAFTEKGIYQLKLKLSVHPPSASVPACTMKVNRSMLFSADFADVTFVCPGGIFPAHRNVLAANNAYFKAYFSGPWLEQHPDGRWETEKSANVMRAVLSLIYTGEAPFELSDGHLLAMLEAAYEFQFDSDLLRVCQAKCIANISVSNVKDLFLSAKLHGASFLFDAAFKFVCEHFAEVAADPDAAKDLIEADGELWREIVKSSQKPSRKRQRT